MDKSEFLTAIGILSAGTGLVISKPKQEIWFNVLSENRIGLYAFQDAIKKFIAFGKVYGEIQLSDILDTTKYKKIEEAIRSSQPKKEIAQLPQTKCPLCHGSGFGFMLIYDKESKRWHKVSIYCGQCEVSKTFKIEKEVKLWNITDIIENYSIPLIRPQIEFDFYNAFSMAVLPSEATKEWGFEAAYSACDSYTKYWDTVPSDEEVMSYFKNIKLNLSKIGISGLKHRGRNPFDSLLNRSNT